jgi:membrane protein implicated in regulation of membrane protease activity
VLVLTGAICCYLASPNQRWLKAPVRRLAWVGGAAILMALALLLQWAGPATAIFIVVTLAMLILTVAPVVIAWVRRPKGRA